MSITLARSGKKQTYKKTDVPSIMIVIKVGPALRNDNAEETVGADFAMTANITRGVQPSTYAVETTTPGSIRIVSSFCAFTPP